jgi:hypothetical protein
LAFRSVSLKFFSHKMKQKEVQDANCAQKANIRSQAPSNYQFCFPSMEGNINCMHSKLMLLAHKSHLRIVVPSANLVPYDWGEAGGVMENVSALTPDTDWRAYPTVLSYLPCLSIPNSVISANYDEDRQNNSAQYLTLANLGFLILTCFLDRISN